MSCMAVMAAEERAACLVHLLVSLLGNCEPRLPVANHRIKHDTTHRRTPVVSVSRYSLCLESVDIVFEDGVSNNTAVGSSTVAHLAAEDIRLPSIS